MPTACRDGVACQLSVQQSSLRCRSRVCPRYRRTFRPSRGHRRYRVITSNNSYTQHFVVRGRPEERPPWSCGRRPAAPAACQLRAHTVLGPSADFLHETLAVALRSAVAMRLHWSLDATSFYRACRRALEPRSPFGPHPLVTEHSYSEYT